MKRGDVFSYEYQDMAHMFWLDEVAEDGMWGWELVLISGVDELDVISHRVFIPHLLLPFIPWEEFPKSAAIATWGLALQEVKNRLEKYMEEVQDYRKNDRVVEKRQDILAIFFLSAGIREQYDILLKISVLMKEEYDQKEVEEAMSLVDSLNAGSTEVLDRIFDQ